MARYVVTRPVDPLLPAVTLVEKSTCLGVLGPILLNLGMFQKIRTEISRKATIHHIALYLSAGLKRELGGLVHTCTLRDGWL